MNCFFITHSVGLGGTIAGCVAVMRTGRTGRIEEPSDCDPGLPHPALSNTRMLLAATPRWAAAG